MILIDLINRFNPIAETAVLMLVLWVIYRVVLHSWAFWQLARGVDERYSSSLFQGLAWTIVVFGAYVVMYLSRVHVGSTEALGEIPANVLTALGLSLGTTVAAAAITSSHVANDPDYKPKAIEPWERSFAALVSDDKGRPNLPKAQLMVWTFVALGTYVVATAGATAATLATAPGGVLPPLPDIDTTLLVLSGIGQGAYLATKVVGKPPNETQVARAPATAGDQEAGTDAATAAVAATAAASAGVTSAVAIPVSVRVPGFVPSVNGLQFTNSFPPMPALRIPLPGLGSLPVGDASNGVCGGMVFTVRDVFETRGEAPVTTKDLPKEDSKLFKYIVDRLLASFDIPRLGFLRYYEWMQTPDGDAGWPPLLMRRGVAWKTIVEEWPARIRPDLDAGRLCCLGLVTASGSNPGDLGLNHQVLAYGYDLDAANRLTIHVYDPNTAVAGADKVTLALDLAHPEHATPIASTVAISHPVRGFFRVGYAYRNPKGLLA